MAPNINGSTSTAKGLTGVLTEQADAWYYKRNLGNGTFGAAGARSRPSRPSPHSAAGGSNCSTSLAKAIWTSFSTTAPWPVSMSAHRGGRLGAIHPFQVAAQHRHKGPESPLRRRYRRRLSGHPDFRGHGLHLVRVAGEGRLRAGAARRPKAGTRKRARSSSSPIPTQIDLPGRHGPATGSRTSCASAAARSAIGRTSATAGSAPRSRWAMRRSSTLRTFSIHGASISPTSTARAIPTSSMSAGDGISLYFNQSGNFWSRAAPRSRVFRGPTA